MYCPHCGKKIPANSVYCQYCGYSIVNNNKSSNANGIKQEASNSNRMKEVTSKTNIQSQDKHDSRNTMSKAKLDALDKKLNARPKHNNNKMKKSTIVKIISMIIVLLVIIIGAYDIHWPTSSVPSGMQNRKLYSDSYDTQAYVIHGNKMKSFMPIDSKYKTNFDILKVRLTHFGHRIIVYGLSNDDNNPISKDDSAIGTVRITINGPHSVKEKVIKS